MLTIQELQSYTFEKALINGYDMKSVDELMERVVEDFSAMQRENAVLRSKMKVLLEKVDEYRERDEEVRRTLVTAQGVAKDTVAKAEAEAAQIRASVSNMADARANELKSAFVAEEARLEEAKRKNAEFAARLAVVYEAQMKTLIKLTTAAGEVATPPVEPKESTQRIAKQSAEFAATSQIARISQDTAPVPTVHTQVPAKAEPVHMSEHDEDYVREAPARHVDKGTARFDFGELKFGAGYHPN